MASASPYSGTPASGWRHVTEQLIAKHPLKSAELVEVVLLSWDAIFVSRIGPRAFRIGADIFPKPQILGFLLHELIPLEFQSRYPKLWRLEEKASDQDLVHLTRPQFSIEIKTSSSVRSIFGNRSYAQDSNTSKKDKAGYYLAINFGKCTRAQPRPSITVIRFGWLDHTDWKGQAAATGQQARLERTVEERKLLRLYPS
jgi:hypothetical protein